MILNANWLIHIKNYSTKFYKADSRLRIFPPLDLANCIRDGKAKQQIRCVFGQLALAAQVYRRKDGSHFQRALDPSVDASRWSVIALERMIDLGSRLPFEEAAIISQKWGLNVSKSELERLSGKISSCLQTQVESKLTQVALKPLATGVGRIVTIAIDGVFTLGRANQGQCLGIEIKSIVISPANSPSQRTMLAGVYQPSELLPLVSGLLRVAGLRAEDTLIGLSDGAIWIEQLFASLGIRQVIDVYHTTLYLTILFEALGWSIAEQTIERRLWSKGMVNAKDWLAIYAVLIKQKEQSPKVMGALAYLESRVEKMNYAQLNAAGIPIGSGQVEAMNKSVIGSRMKRSGMQWSRVGASRMALLRSQVRSVRPVMTPMAVRYSAFPIPF